MRWTKIRDKSQEECGCRPLKALFSSFFCCFSVFFSRHAMFGAKSTTVCYVSDLWLQHALPCAGSTSLLDPSLNLNRHSFSGAEHLPHMTTMCCHCNIISHGKLTALKLPHLLRSGSLNPCSDNGPLFKNDMCLPWSLVLQALVETGTPTMLHVYVNISDVFATFATRCIMHLRQPFEVSLHIAFPRPRLLAVPLGSSWS